MIELSILGSADLAGIDPEATKVVLHQPKRLALLAYLAVAGRDRFVRRDALLALFWPEQSEERARHALRQALHALRGALGPSAIIGRGNDELSVDAGSLRCDAAEFERLLDAGRPAEALALYRGDLLAGFFVASAADFERWLDEARVHLRARAAAAAGQLATDAESSGALDCALRWARQAHELAPDDEGILRRLMAVMDRTGDRAGALQAYARFVKWLEQELEVTPSPETRALERDIRARVCEQTSGQAVASIQVPSVGTSGAAEAKSEPPTASQARRWWWLATAAGTLTLVATLVVTYTGGESVIQGQVVPPVSTSTIARRLYDEGMRAWTDGDHMTAERLMRQAVAEDSMFGLARLQLGHFMGMRGAHAEALVIQQQAVALAPRQSDHDRLLLMARFTRNYADPRQLAFAETLAIRYPSEVEGQLLAANARRTAGAFIDAIAPLRRVITLAAMTDSASAQCLMCEAYAGLIDAYEHADSGAAGVRVAQEWTRARPIDADAWFALSYQLAIQDRYSEALVARHRGNDLRPSASSDNSLSDILIRAGDYRTVENLLDARTRAGNRDAIEDAQHLRWRWLREQARYREALDLVLELDRRSSMPEGERGYITLLRAQSLYETGRYRESARIWDSLTNAVRNRRETPSAAGALRASYLSQLANVLGAMGDTMRLARLVDSVRVEGAKHAWGRNRLLHHFVRGEYAMAAGRWSDACDAFRQSIFSRAASFVRANLAAGRACIAAGRPAEALVPLRGVLRGPVGAGGTYGTFTEAHDLMARALYALGEPDSARTHDQRVIDAWQSGDEPYRARAAAARARLAQ